MLEILKGLAVSVASSRKAAALLLGLLTTIIALPLIKWLGVPEAQATEQAGLIAGLIAAQVSAYLIGQGVADHGKEKAKAEASNKTPPKEPQP